MSSSFVHLHCHSHYSLLDGAGRIGDLLDVAQRHGMPALALTDHGNLFGAIDFHNQAVKRGIQPILGYEAYLAPGSRKDTSRDQKSGGYYHLTLLAKDRAGWKNLMQLASAAYLEGFYRKPRIDKELLRAHREGLVVLSGCLRSEVCTALLEDDHESAGRALDELAELFGDDLFVEIQYNGIEKQRRVAGGLLELADAKGLPVVLTNDVHYPTPESARGHEVLLCIQTAKTLADEGRFRFSSTEFYLKSAEEMAQIFPERPDAMANTLEVARRCRFELPFEGHHLPPFVPPDGSSVEAHLRGLCLAGLKQRYGDPLPPPVTERFDHEYRVITEMGFATYFLIVADFIRHARDKGIAVGPGRGSAAGSIVAYALSITNIDPLRWDLIFERFLNEGRRELPDIDIDFDAERRGEVIDYVVAKYGREQVCQIITFNKIQAKSGLRDVGRVLGIPLAKVNRIAKLVPVVPGIKLDDALAAEPDLKQLYETDVEVTEMVDIARGLEGIVRQTGVHAAGVIIADRPVREYCPLQRVDEEVTTQFPMEECSALGLLKMDFLGLRNLTIIERALDLIQARAGQRPNLDALPWDDRETYALLGRGETRGIFQLESSGMRDILMRLLPDRFEDLIAVVALFRPGPLGSGMVDRYIECKHGRAKPHYLHPMLQEALAETHGVILYQEQVMRIATKMGGLTLTEADKLRKAMGKKKPEIMAAYREQFEQGATARGIDPKLAGEIFDLMAEFAQYGFNKSHSAAYALVAYQTAWLKAHWPTEFMAALLTCNAADTDRIAEYVEECKRDGIRLLPPDLNASQPRFTVEGDRTIRYGLAAIKLCGEKGLETLFAARSEGGPFKDLADLVERIDTRKANKGVLESLIRAGACDAFGHRAQLVTALEPLLKNSAGPAPGRLADQLGLFDDSDEEPPPLVLPTVDRWTEREQLQEEKKALGFYFSGHPLKPYEPTLAAYSTATTASLEAQGDRKDVRIGGLVTRLKTAVVRKGQTAGRKYARFTLEDLSGACGAVAFPEVYERYQHLLVDDQLVFLSGQVDTTGTDPGIVVSKVVPLAEVESAYATCVLIRLDATRHKPPVLESLKRLLAGSPGQVPVYVELTTEAREVVYLATGRGLAVTPTSELASGLARLVGYEGFSYQASGN